MKNAVFTVFPEYSIFILYLTFSDPESADNNRQNKDDQIYNYYTCAGRCRIIIGNYQSDNKA